MRFLRNLLYTLKTCKCFHTNSTQRRLRFSLSDKNKSKSNSQLTGGLTKMRANPIVMKLNTPEFRSVFTDELQTLVDLFCKYNYELRIAGGAVRDILMEITPKDIDFATTATPDQMKNMFTLEKIRMINPKGEKHGTITARINDKENFEVTTLRIDVLTDGRHAEVQFTTDWQLDANRRDLTVNSMFLGFDGTLYDYFYGYEDLQQRRVVFVGDANIRIKEDFLRILRYFRFYGRIASESAKHDETTLKAIRANAQGLANISGERIWGELQKILLGNYSEEIILEMINSGLMSYCGLPQMPNLKEFKRLCLALKDFEKPHKPVLLMISLLNSVEDAIKLHGRLKFSAHERDLAFFITQQREKVDDEYVSLRDYQKLCLHTSIRRDFVEELLKYKHKKELYNSLISWEIPPFPVNGNILKDKASIPSKKIGLILSELKLIWADNNFQLSSEELLEKHLPQVIENLVTAASSPSYKKVKKA
uniref:Poly A polymerase head domain-containing protein n=1 Tax=Glossina brevipalpis TaxID=37001 RepID=A0A1A9X1T7_9MUSC